MEQGRLDKGRWQGAVEAAADVDVVSVAVPAAVLAWDSAVCAFVQAVGKPRRISGGCLVTV